jgi:hypothetical protein
MVVDLDRFTPGEAELRAGLFTVLEQLPGRVTIADMTSTLAEDGYWASYNVPVFPDIRELSGFTRLEVLSDEYSHKKCVRGRIFAQLAPNVTTFEEFKNVMTYNKWQTDPLSEGSPGNAIMSRFDLDFGKDAQAFGTSVLVVRCSSLAL